MGGVEWRRAGGDKRQRVAKAHAVEREAHHVSAERRRGEAASEAAVAGVGERDRQWQFGAFMRQAGRKAIDLDIVERGKQANWAGLCGGTATSQGLLPGENLAGTFECDCAHSHVPRARV